MSPTGSPSHDKIYKIRPLLECITQAFRSVYTPRQNLSIDETIISFKGRLSWIQYMPKKPHKWGIKAWALADSSNGYNQILSYIQFLTLFYPNITLILGQSNREGSWT